MKATIGLRLAVAKALGETTGVCVHRVRKQQFQLQAPRLVAAALTVGL